MKFVYGKSPWHLQPQRSPHLPRWRRSSPLPRASRGSTPAGRIRPTPSGTSPRRSSGATRTSTRRLSADAGLFGNRLGLDEAYRFARGEEVISSTGQPAKLGRPLDWLAVTDHSDAMGFATDLFKGAPAIVDTQQGSRWFAAMQAGGDAAAAGALDLITTFAQGNLEPALVAAYYPGSPAYDAVWKSTIDAAERYYDPGRFTTFIGFEWTSLVAGQQPPPQRDLPRRRRACPAGATHGHARPDRIDRSAGPLRLARGLRGEDGRRRAGHRAQRQPVERDDVSLRDAAHRRSRRPELRHAARQVGAALRGHPDQGHGRDAPAPVARRRVRRLRDLGRGQPRPLGSEDARDAPAGIRPRGAEAGPRA